MASSIGIRVYLVTINKKGDRTKLSFKDKSLARPPAKFISQFVKAHLAPTQDDERERSWYFEQREAPNLGSTKGYVHYGTFGFESNFKDSTTKKTNYRRKTTDVEEIPLFYEFWCPPDTDFGFMAFQSFQGRSCISLVMQQMRDEFSIHNPEIYLGFKRLIPSDSKGSIFFNSPVKRLRLIKKNVSSDIADRYLSKRTADQINLEISLTTKRRGILGHFGELTSSMKKDTSGVITHDGILFDEAVADIKVGNRIRPVGIFGDSNDVGLIDLTDSINRGPNGHPTFASISTETTSILADFYSTIVDTADL